MGFHCIDVNGVCKARLQTTKFNSLLNFLAIQYLPNQVFMRGAHYALLYKVTWIGVDVNRIIKNLYQNRESWIYSQQKST